MLILIAVAVFLASAFKTVGKNILELVGQKVTTFINVTANYAEGKIEYGVQ